MKKAELKQKAQDSLLHFMLGAFYEIYDDSGMTDVQKTEEIECLSKQMARIEKIFGYTPYSCTRS